ncbi:M1 family metallopeptidase [Candidatus Nomurabacteria bacterium]|nr:M1 family metallopeptidase [Candidatus Nomurabacteria bacterium]
MKNKAVRLSKNIIPLEYEIELKPDLDNFTFSGIETITISVLKKTKIITLHSKEIEIDTVDINKIFAKISYDKKSETVSFVFPKIIPAGKVKLTLVFKGILNDKMRGFYRSRYSIGEKEYNMATTQFEATDARRAFPCFDEPAHKAIFHVSLIVPKGKTAISNTLPISVAEHESNFEIVKFSPTPKMSTYLLAFIVGDFEYIEGKTKSNIQVRVFTTPGKKHQAKFALDCAIKTLEFYEKYFDIAYPLPILDMIAIPDFASGAMENWGAVTYRESALLVDENNSSTSNKQWVALVVAHELAHQWFGNLVTMEWWTHLWLNEGFASYIEYLAVDKLFPNWDIWTQFSTHDLGVALRLDSLKSTHPIEVEVHHPDEIGEIFDEVSYSKGASVIRMLADYLGEDKFRDGLRYYLKKHSYKNTETIHLWQAFEKVSGKSVSKMMHNWTSKPGYPVVNANMVNGKIRFSQERFFASPISREEYNKKTKNKTKWEIPITYKQDKVNFGETGFFRTAYSKELLERLYKPIEDRKLSARDRLGVIRDLFALSEAGIIPTTDALEFLKAYKNEDNYTVWLEIAMGISKLEQLVAKTKINLNPLILELFSPIFSKLGWDKKEMEHHTDAMLRSLILSRLGKAGDKKIISEASKRFSAIKKGGAVSPDIRGVIYSIVAYFGSKKQYEDLIKLYKKETLHEEKNRIGNALGDFTDPEILKLVCEFAMSPNVRIQDTVGVLSGVGSNPIGRDIWWNFMQKNWKTLVSRYGEGGLTLGKAVKAIGGSAEEKHFKLIKKFFATHEAPGAKRAIEQVLERLEGNIAWLKRDKKIIDKFLLQ